MPACPRKEVVDPETVGVYHCWNRCVRRAWLCGLDPLTDQDHEHRRRWIESREALLARLFAIEIGWHAELSNHLHLILRNRPDVVETWSDEEVVRRVLTINGLTRRFSDDDLEAPADAEVALAVGDPDKVATYRRRLSDISAFMASLDEYIARRANTEDGVSGSFWEGRFRCRNLEDEAAILVCGIYVDLNQIRAGEAATPEESTHTSAYNRICAARLAESRAAGGEAAGGLDESAAEVRGAATRMPPDGWLCELTLQAGLDADVRDGLTSSTPWRLTDKGLLPLPLDDYLSLLDWTGRQQASGKPGSIPAQLVPILQRLHIRPRRWLESIGRFETLFGRAIGRAAHVERRAADSGRRWIRGARYCREAFT